MIIVKTTEFLDWILRQPDNRKLDMLNTAIFKDSVGCLMAEYAKDTGIGGTIVGGSSVFYLDRKPLAEFEPGISISDFCPTWCCCWPSWNAVKTFGQVKSFLSSEEFRKSEIGSVAKLVTH